MANTSVKIGFRTLNPRDCSANQYLMNSGEATKEGDLLYMNSSGKITGTYDSSYPIVGIQVAPFTTNGVVPTTYTSTSASVVSVFDSPGLEFIGQIAHYEANYPFVTQVATTAYDVAGSAGAQYIDNTASTYDTFKVLRLAPEYDTGKLSVVGDYAKVVCKINPLKHIATKQS